jgi:5'-3' exonuclease
MGLNNFLGFIRQKYPHLLVSEHLSIFAYQYCFVDIASYIYKYICIMGTADRTWMASLFKLLTLVRSHKLVPVVIFDGKQPDEKAGEIKERKESKQKQIDRANKLEQLLSSTNTLYSEDELAFLKQELSRMKQECLSINFMEEEPENNTISSLQRQQLEKHLQNLQRAIFYLPEQDAQLFRQLLSLSGVLWYQAPYEAESLCCFLSKEYPGSCVLSCDTDCIAHRAPYTILQLDPKNGFIQYMEYEQVREQFQFTSDSQMIDWAILIGCDYNKSQVRDNKIGAVTGLKLIQQHKKLEDIPKLKLESLCIDECRRMFNPSYQSTDFPITHRKPQVEKIKSLLSKKEDNVLLYRVLGLAHACEDASSIELFDSECQLQDDQE